MKTMFGLRPAFSPAKTTQGRAITTARGRAMPARDMESSRRGSALLEVAGDRLAQLAANAAVVFLGALRRVPGRLEADGDAARAVAANPVGADLLPVGVVGLARLARLRRDSERALHRAGGAGQ